MLVEIDATVMIHGPWFPAVSHEIHRKNDYVGSGRQR